VVFVLNRVLDRIARELSLDPVEVRRRNMIPPQDLPHKPGILYRDGTPMMLDSGNYPEALDRLVDAIGYADFRRDQETQRRNGRHVGIGIACNVESGGIGPVEAARVKIDPSGQVIVYLGVTDTGQGQRTSFAQVCAESLGVHPDRITVVTGDTAGIPYSRGTYHSRAAVTAGNAVHGAAQKVRQKVLEIASQHFEAAVDDIELVDGSARVKGVPDMALSLARCAQIASPETALPRGILPGLDELHYFEAPTVVWGNAAHAAIVEVDPKIGAVRILRYVVVHDCGRVLNPTILAGQIHGGVAAGIGGTLLEHLVYDAEGQLLTASLADYMLPRASDIPEIELISMETPSPLNPLGAKGAGEGGTIAPPSVLAAAVEDALAPLGVRITRTPLSPKTILAAIRAQGGGAC
jgi:CO/xanthine dehydrogenase Mo-binding subunit